MRSLPEESGIQPLGASDAGGSKAGQREADAIRQSLGRAMIHHAMGSRNRIPDRVTSLDFVVMGALEDKSPMTVIEIASKSGATLSTVSRTINELLERGLVNEVSNSRPKRFELNSELLRSIYSL